MKKFDWKPKNIPIEILASFSDHRTQKDGRLLVSMDELTAVAPSAILSFLRVPDGVSNALISQAIRSALFSARYDGKIEPANFISTLNVELDKLLKRRPVDYILCYEWRFSGVLPIHSLKMGQVAVTFPSAARCAHIVRERAKIDPDRIVRSDFDELTSIRENIRLVTARVNARNIHEAEEIGSLAIEELRGLANFLVNLGKMTIVQFGRPPKFAQHSIGRGKFATVHLPNLKLAGHFLWSTLDEDTGGKTVDVTNSQALQLHFRGYANLIRHSPLGQDIREILVRYAAALDRRHLSTVFLELWNLLEHMTASGAGNYELLIKRCAALFKQEAIVKELLEFLRISRNNYVHQSLLEPNDDKPAQQAKFFFEHMLRFIIENRFHLRNLQEVGEFLSAPRDVLTIRRRVQILQRADRFRSS